jgi:hypothetical protein
MLLILDAHVEWGNRLETQIDASTFKFKVSRCF